MELTGQDASRVGEQRLSCQHKHLYIYVCEPVTQYGCGFLRTYPPCAEVNSLTEMENKLREREGEWLQVCVCESVCGINSSWEEKFKWKAVFTLDLLDKNAGVVFINVLREWSSHWSATNNILSLQQGLTHRNINHDNIPNFSFEQHDYK